MSMRVLPLAALRPAVVFAVTCWSCFCAAQTAGPATRRSDLSVFQLQHTSWTSRDGVPQAINAIAQGDDGMLWLGTENGLFRFDGISYEHIVSVDDEVTIPKTIRGLLFTSNGKLWIGTPYSGVILLQGTKVTRFEKIAGLPPNTGVTTFVEAWDGAIWGTSQSGLVRYDGKQWTAVGAEWGVIPRESYRVFRDPHGVVFAFTDNHGLFFLAPGQHCFQRYGSLEGVSELSSNGELWGMTRVGVCRLADLKRKTSAPFCLVRGDWKDLPSFTFDRKGNLWLYAGEWGLKRVGVKAILEAETTGKTAEPESFGTSDGLTSNFVRRLAMDRQDGIWVATANGLDHLREPAFIRPYPPLGFGSFGLAPAAGGNVWVSSDQGLHLVDSAIGASQFALKEAFIESLFLDPNGQLFFAAKTNHLIQRYSQGDQPLAAAKPIPDQVAVQSIVTDNRGALWASWIPFGLAKWDGRRWIKNGGFQHLSDAYVILLSKDRRARIWAGYLDGEVAVFDDLSVTRYRVKDGPRIGPVVAIASVGNEIWLGGRDGLSIFDGKAFHAVREADGRSFFGIGGITKDSQDNVWMNTFSGLRRIRKPECERLARDPSYAVTADLYDISDGIPSAPIRVRPFPTAITSGDGRVWFSFEEGVVFADPTDPKLDTPRVKTSILRAVVDGRTIDTARVFEVPPGAVNLEVDFAAASLDRANRLRFRYKLDGFDDTWRDAGGRRQAYFSKLPPGSYRFLVTASNGDSLWSVAPARITFRVLPAYYQTWWFRGLCLAALSGLVWFAFRWRLIQTVSKIKDHFRHRMLEREQIARDLHDTLLQAVFGASLQVETAYGRLEPDSPALGPLARALEMMRKASTEGRLVVHGLRSSRLGALSLEQAFSKVEEDLDVPESVDLHVLVEGQSRPVQTMVKDEVYRIGHEAIANALQHSGASRIDITITYFPNRLTIAVQDNGKGIESSIMRSGRAGHWGLQGMRERAENIGAKFGVFSRVGSGVEITLEVPGSVAFHLPDADESDRKFLDKWKSIWQGKQRV